MKDDFVFALLPTRQQRPAAPVVQIDRLAVRLEVRQAQLAQVEQGDDKAVAERRAQLLHQVEREGGAPGPQRVQIADRGVEPHALQRGARLAGEQRVGKGQGGVDLVLWRPAAADAQREAVCLRAQHAVKAGEVGRRGRALHAAHAVHVRAVCQLKRQRAELFGALFQLDCVALGRPPCCCAAWRTKGRGRGL